MLLDIVFKSQKAVMAGTVDFYFSAVGLLFKHIILFIFSVLKFGRVVSV
jgi:hypothetical protein